jgi:hypothetical protein
VQHAHQASKQSSINYKSGNVLEDGEDNHWCVTC